VSAEIQRPPEATLPNVAPGGLAVSPPLAASQSPVASLARDDSSLREQAPATLGALPLGARLLLRCRADWRGATIASIAPDSITLSVCSPRGRTYRVRRPPDSLLSFDGPIPTLGDGCWRASYARYDARW
jgi:hypothetical protein